MKEQDRKKVSELLTLINEYSHKLIDPSESPEAIVKDILKGHIRDFYEQIDRLDLYVPPAPSSGDHGPHQEEKPAEPEQKQEKNTGVASAEEVNQEEHESIEEMKKSLENLRMKFEHMEKSPASEEKMDKEPAPEMPQQEPEKEEIPSIEKPAEERQKTTASEETKKEDAPMPEVTRRHGTSEPPQKKVIGDRYEDDKSSVNDFLSVKNGTHSIGERLKHHQIHDLKKAIDINHKFLFIRELFNGNSQEYNRAIERLNEAGSMEEAVTILDEFREKYSWNEKEEALNIFNELIHRKF